jgi:TonB family protein
MRARFETGALIVCAAFSMATAEAAETPPHIDASGVNMQPAYPASAAKTNEQGAAVLDVAVGGDGKVERIRLRQTSGFNDLDSAAIGAVMGWRFVPATSDGKNVAGATTIALGFQPPTEGDAASAPAAAPKPAGDLFPPSFEIEAPRGKFDTRMKPVPCRSGRIVATVEFRKPEGPAEDRWPPQAWLMIKNGDDRVDLDMQGRLNITPPIEQFALFVPHKGGDRVVQQFSYARPLGTIETMSVAWNTRGLITGRVASMESHEVRMTWLPIEAGFAASGGTARFLDSQLICMPDDAPDSDE